MRRKRVEGKGKAVCDKFSVVLGSEALGLTFSAGKHVSCMGSKSGSAKYFGFVW